MTDRRSGVRGTDERRKDRRCTHTFVNCDCGRRYCPDCFGGECPECEGIGAILNAAMRAGQVAQEVATYQAIRATKTDDIEGKKKALSEVMDRMRKI